MWIVELYKEEHAVAKMAGVIHENTWI
jgi:hypothetical protein